MDFLDPKKKRQHQIRLYIGYVLMAIIVVLGALILLFQSYGYDLDRKTGEIIQNGLVFVSAHPEPADIYLNNKLYKSQDDARLVLPAATYTLELKRAGYRTWRRTFSLMGGSLERFVYPFLFPEKLTTADQKTYSAAPAFATATPDRRWILVQQPGQLGTFDVFDASNFEQPPTTLTIPVAVFTASQEHTLKLVEWSTDNRHVLLEHIFKEGREFVVLDRETPASSVNVNKTFSRTPFQVSLRDKKFDQLYVFDQTAGRLELGTLKDAAVKLVLEDVAGYKSHGDDVIIYAAKTPTPSGKTRIMIRDNDGKHALREVAPAAKYLLEVARFDDRWYMVAGSPADGKVYVYKDPQPVLKHQTSVPLIPATVLRVQDSTTVAFSANTRFVMAQGGSRFAVYDAENDRSFHYDTKLPLEPGHEARWMDGHRLVVTSQGKLTVFDYDGINMQTLTPNQPGLLPFFDRDYELLYTVAPSAKTPGAYALTRTGMKIVPATQ